MPDPCSSLPGHLGTQHSYIWQVQDKLLHGELPHVSVEPHHRRGHILSLTKWAEENWLHTNAYKIKPAQFQCFLPYVVMSRGFINKSCISRGLNLNRVFFTSAPHCFLADCSVSASVGSTWWSACPHSRQSRQSLSWEMAGAWINISRIVWTVTASLFPPALAYTCDAAAASAQSQTMGGAEELLPIYTCLRGHCALDGWPFPGYSLCTCWRQVMFLTINLLNYNSGRIYLKIYIM